MASEIVEPRIYRFEEGPLIIAIVSVALGATVVYWLTRSNILTGAILAIEIPFAAILWWMQLHVTVDRNGIVWRRHGRAVVMPWPQIRRVETGSSGLTISDGYQSIEILRPYPWFDELREILRQNAPASAFEEVRRFPFTLPGSNSKFLLLWLVGLLGLTSFPGFWVIWRGGNTSAGLAWLGMWAVVAAILAVSMCRMPSRYEFTREGVEAVGPFQRERYSWDDFEAIMKRRDRQGRVLVLKFTKGALGLNSVGTPQEKILDSLKEELGPRYREEPDPLNPRLI